MARASCSMKPGWRERDDVVGCFVIVEVVVVVLEKEDRRRAKIRAIDRYDLRVGGEFQHRFIFVAEDERRTVETVEACIVPAGRRDSGGMQIPIDVITICDHRLRLKGKRATQHSVSNGGGQISSRVGVRATGAREEQDPKALRPRTRGGKCCEFPGLAQWLTIGGAQRKRIAPVRLKTSGVELPERALGVIHLTAKGGDADPQCRPSSERLCEGRLD